MLYYCYKTGRYFARKLRIETCYRVATIVADVYYFFAREDKRCLKHNMEIVLGVKDKKLIRGYAKNVFRNFAKYLADFFRVTRREQDSMMQDISVEGKENLDKALASGKGAILLSAHIGNWELGAGVIACMGYPLHAVVLAHKDKRINDFFLEQRTACGVKVIGLGAQLKNCFKILKKNKALAIVGDRDFSNYGLSVNFFGQPAVLPKGPAFFSVRTGAPIIGTFLLRTKDDKFKLFFEEAVHPKKTGDHDADMRDSMSRYIPQLEKYIKRFPDQWYAYRKVWE